MNKVITLVFVLFSVLYIKAQDTIQVARNYKTIMIFPDIISESIIGNDLNFNMEPPSKKGKFSERIVKLYYNEVAREKKDFTNLIVITDNGNTYEFTLRLVDKPNKTTWYIKEDVVVNNLKGKKEINQLDDMNIASEIEIVKNKLHLYSQIDEGNNINEVNLVGKDSLNLDKREARYEMLYNNDRMEYYRLRCYYMQFDKTEIIRYYSKQGNVYLWLKGIYFNRNELYVQFRVENKESVDFDINFVRFGIATNYKKYATYQDTELKPVYRYKIPKKVIGNTENHFVVVFKKFSLNSNKTLKVELNEEFGNRDITMEIDDFKINNPIRF